MGLVCKRQGRRFHILVRHRSSATSASRCHLTALGKLASRPGRSAGGRGSSAAYQKANSNSHVIIAELDRQAGQSAA